MWLNVTIAKPDKVDEHQLPRLIYEGHPISLIIW